LKETEVVKMGWRSERNLTCRVKMITKQKAEDWGIKPRDGQKNQRP